ncbi:MAG: hypothetical protein WD904_04060 [Dehalococcoidia bacterium]
MDDKNGPRTDITGVRRRHTLRRPPQDWLAAAAYAITETAAVLLDTLSILLASLALRLRIAHWHGHTHTARG